MNGRDVLITLGVLGLILFMAGSSFIGGGTNIVKAVDDNYSLKDTEGNIRVYQSDDSLDTTIRKIDSLKQPYDQQVDASGKGVLLYDEAVIIVEDKDGITEIELIKDHKTAYNRHRNTMFLFWGSNIYRDGRIRTPRSIRRGSIGSSPSRGGGFGFGK